MNWYDRYINDKNTKVELIGENYVGHFSRIRTACRAIIMDQDSLLTSYETNTNQYMFPGGGIEINESDNECVIREVEEETGYIIDSSKQIFEIDEYYGNEKFVTKYFFGTIKGKTSTKLTQREKEVGMTPKWVQIDELYNIFSTYSQYEDINEMRRGLYLRELTAIKNVFNK